MSFDISINGTLKLRFWPTVITAAGFAILLSFSVWQLQRMEWKRDLLQALETNPTLEIVVVGREPITAERSQFQYRRAIATGRFLHEKEMLRPARLVSYGYTADVKRKNPHALGTFGYNILTPFRTDNGTMLLVNRGWVPQTARDPAKRKNDRRIFGRTTVSGLLLIPDKKPWWQTSVPTDNFWIWPDLPAMAARAGIREFSPVILDVGPTTQPQDVYPIPGQTRKNFTNNHLLYAVTWFGMAFILLLVYVLSQWHPGRKK